MALTKETLRALRVAIDEALAPVAKAQNLKHLRAGSCTYDPNGTFTFKVEGVVEGGLDADGARYKNEQKLLGLPDLGTQFPFRGASYAIEGLKSGGKIVAKLVGTEQRYKFDRDVVIGLCAKAEKKP
jgi:hypothetical protein